MKFHRSTRTLVAGSAALALVLAGCSTDESTDATAANASATTSASEGSETESSAAVVFEDAYIKEKPADKVMTGIFGVLKNNTDEELEVTDFRVEGLKDGTVFEQHSSKDGKMFKIEGGHKIPANGEHELAPGGDHFMIMDNDEAMEPGQLFTVVMELSDGSTLTQEISVRVQPAGEEDYGEDGGLSNPGMGEDGEMTNMNEGDEHSGH